MSVFTSFRETSKRQSSTPCIIPPRLRSLHAFTLVELMVVILIVAMISTVAGVKYMSYLETAKVAATKTQISQFKAAVEAFYLFENSYPDSLEDLIHGTDNHPAGYLDAKSVPKDPWGNPYEYEVTDEIETPFVVISYGADKTEGGDGNNADIRSDNLSGSAE